ncbi:DNA helicase RecG, partial [Patescibacteria group bacterium]|nr:DNA helicase RecG [Patescibacteria group bacterium]
MFEVNSPISVVPKIGPKYQATLEKLGIVTVENLLYHFPFRYQDFTKIKPINELQDGEVVTVKAILGSVQNIFTKNRKRITKAKVLDHTGELDIIWFNQHYIKNSLETGKTYNISGKVGTFDRKLCFISPEMEPTSDVFSSEKAETIHTGRLVPIYPETYGVSSKWLRTKINFL